MYLSSLELRATVILRDSESTSSQGNIQPRLVPAVLTRTRKDIPDVPICGQSGPRFPFKFPTGRIGKRGSRFKFPDSRSRPNRETGIPSPFPGKIGNRGNGNLNLGFPGLGDRHARSLRRPAVSS